MGSTAVSHCSSPFHTTSNVFVGPFQLPQSFSADVVDPSHSTFSSNTAVSPQMQDTVRQQLMQLQTVVPGQYSVQQFSVQPTNTAVVLDQFPVKPAEAPPMPTKPVITDPEAQQTFCGVRDPLLSNGRSGRVLGGRPSEFGAWPWMVSLSFKNHKSRF